MSKEILEQYPNKTHHRHIYLFCKKGKYSCKSGFSCCVFIKTCTVCKRVDISKYPQCTECKENVHTSDSDCVAKNGYYSARSGFAKSASECPTCYVSGTTNCYSCDSGYVLSGNTYNKCHTNCNTKSSGNSNQWCTCSSPKYISGGSCVCLNG